MSFDHCNPPRLETLGALGQLDAHPDASPRLTRLTTREHEVLRRIADGQSTSQIAKELAIASSTARTHASNVLLKLNARSRIQAAAAVSPLSPLISEPPEPDALAALTRREREVLACMTEGQSQAATAERLCVSPNTVRTHTRNILSKLGVHSTLEAAALVRRLTTAPPSGPSPGPPDASPSSAPVLLPRLQAQAFYRLRVACPPG